jgi:hypothetical protein
MIWGEMEWIQSQKKLAEHSEVIITQNDTWSGKGWPWVMFLKTKWKLADLRDDIENTVNGGWVMTW